MFLFDFLQFVYLLLECKVHEDGGLFLVTWYIVGTQ